MQCIFFRYFQYFANNSREPLASTIPFINKSNFIDIRQFFWTASTYPKVDHSFYEIRADQLEYNEYDKDKASIPELENYRAIIDQITSIECLTSQECHRKLTDGVFMTELFSNANIKCKFRTKLS